MTKNAAKKLLDAINEETQLLRVVRDPFEVLWDKRKPVLPEIPKLDDPASQCSWVTSVLHLDSKHPVIAGEHQGHVGSAGHIVIRRLDAPALRFEPASRLANGQRLADELVWQLLPKDGEPYPWSNAQAIKIARVVRWLCGNSRNITAEQQTELIINSYLEAATAVQGRTHATPGERYEAIVSMRPEIHGGFGDQHGFRYLVDMDSGETLIRVGDLNGIARKVVGGTIPYGWLDARIEGLGWRRRRLEGRGLDRGPEMRGEHARIDVYVGVIES